MNNKIASTVIPSLLTYSRHEFEEKYSYIQVNTSKHTLAHIDVMDGKFVPTTCWCTPQKIRSMNFKRPFEVHLMTNNPERRIAAWKRAGAQRIHFHIEATPNPLLVIDQIHKAHMQAGIALNARTSLKKIELIAGHADAILVMGIQPGKTGKHLETSTFQKLKTLRKKALRVPLLVDGGVSQINASKLLASGAEGLISTSMFYPKELLKKYQ